MKKVLLTILLVLTLLAACAPATTVDEQPTPVEEKDPTPVPTPNLTPLASFPNTEVTPSAELLRFSGSAPASKVLAFSEQTRIRVNWEYTGSTRFEVILNNVDPAARDTQYGSVIFISYNGPTSGFVDYEYIPGAYSVDVTQADGDWTVWVEQLP